MQSQDPPEYVLYLRKSKGRMGIARQRTITTAHVEQLGGRIVVDGEFSDADSTAFRHTGRAQPKRDDFDRMLTVLRARPGLRIAAWHADRLTRNTEDTERLIEICAAGRNIVETPRGGTYDLSTATGRKRLRADALDAQYEVDHGTERITAAKAEHAAEGRWLGGRRPFGWQIIRATKDEPGALVLDEAEAAALASAHRDVLDRKSLHSIKRDWNARGVLTSTGTLWKASEVRRVLLRPMNWAPPPAQWPAVVSEPEHRAVAAILSQPERKTTPGPERRHLLSGIALCWKCGTGLVCSSAGSKRGPRSVYRCPKAAGGGHVARDEATLDDAITRLVIARLSRPDARTLLRKATSDVLPGLRRERAATEALMKESNDLRRRGLLTAAEFAEDRAAHMRQLDQLDARIAAAEEADVIAPLLADPAGVWETRDLDQRRAVINVLMMITVIPSPKGRPKGWRPGASYFDPTSVHIEWRRG